MATPNPLNKRKSTGGTGTGDAHADAIKVICRFRPPKAHVKKDRTIDKSADIKIDSFKLNEERCEVEFVSDYSDGKTFTFDKVFGVDSTQSQVFAEVCGVVDSVMAGFNGAVMAYGQTSAGKSFTMEGPSIWDTEYQGIIPRCIDSLFTAINNADSNLQFQLTISFYEIYCEKVRDLLNPAQVNMKIRESKTEGFVVQDVTEINCTDRESVLRVIELGKANRAAAPTLMNAESSRSHSIVTILVDQRNTQTGRNKRGMLFLVDLAGSEKVSKTGASGTRLEEAKNINSSLTTLGMVINALCESAPHIPYRDSKLTMLMMDALGGNSKTTLIVCCNPELAHTPETLTTLRFGERAKKIKNHAKVNETYSVEELKAMLLQARKEIAQLKAKIAILTNGGDPKNLLGEFEGEEQQHQSHHQHHSSNSNDENNILPSSPVNDPLILQEQSNQLLQQQSQIDQHQQEIAALNAKIVSLEEDLEMERMKTHDEHQNFLLRSSEADALRASIEELEAKLLKSTLESKRVAEAAKGLTSPVGKVRRESNAQLMKMATIQMMNEPAASTIQDEISHQNRLFLETHNNNDSVLTSSSLGGGGGGGDNSNNSDDARSRSNSGRLSAIRNLTIDPTKSVYGFGVNTNTADSLDATAPTTNKHASFVTNNNNTTPPRSAKNNNNNNNKSSELSDDEEEEAVQVMSVIEASDREILDENKRNPHHHYNNKNDPDLDDLREDNPNSMIKLNLQTQALRNQLEAEIKELNNAVNAHHEDTKSAQEAAQLYADKYIRLKEDYESHVQRLMFKLTHEQQTRSHLEDRLEDALSRMWKQSNNKNKGFFGVLFSGGNPFASSGGSGSGNNSGGGGHHGSMDHGSYGGGNYISDRELNLSRSLELAQFRVSQLAAELEANREAQMIVLETKESVMRSLARQNSQLIVERDSLVKRVDDLSLTVDQLTNLLRSVQSRKVVPAPTPKMPATIRGGAVSTTAKNKLTFDFNKELQETEEDS